MSDPLIPDRLHPVVAPALDLERVVPAAGGAAAPGLVCSACNKPVADEYFEIASKATCRSCKAAIEEALTGGSRVARVIRASLAGTVAAVAGAFLYHQLSKATDHEFAIAALVLGAMVGGAVRWGARRRGGWAYRWMAVLLTSAAIARTPQDAPADGPTTGNDWQRSCKDEHDEWRRTRVRSGRKRCRWSGTSARRRAASRCAGGGGHRHDAPIIGSTPPASPRRRPDDRAAPP